MQEFDLPPQPRKRGDMDSSGLFDALSNWFEGLAVRSKYDEKNRLALLAIHATMGILIGALIIVEGGPQAAIAAGIDHVTLGLPAFLGGFLLWSGLLLDRDLRLEALGMSLMLSWDVLMSGLFVWSAMTPDNGVASSLYPIVVYGGMAALMAVHLWTLTVFIRGGRTHGTY